MAFFNDIDLKKWKESEVWTDSLWIINERDKSGKHSNFYHGNFVPQIPRQLIQRYTKKGEVVFDPFIGSGTTAFESEVLERCCIGIDIQKGLIDLIEAKISHNEHFISVFQADSTKSETYTRVNELLKQNDKNSVHLAILHPPYSNIIKFSDVEGDLSKIDSVKEFLYEMSLVIKNTKSILARNRYLAIVIGDKYSSGEWVPLGYYCMNEALKLGLRLKSIIVKNIEGNRAKINKEGIWRC